LGKYVQQTNKWQSETIRLNTRLQTLRQLFVKSDKSLQSISARTNSLSISRESYERRRSSTSESLLKLRLMNGVPTLPKSPHELKSPQK
jgi:hypothetical protein